MRKHIIFAIVAFLLVSCGQSNDGNKSLSRTERQRLRIEDSLALKVSVLPTLDCMPLFIAKEFGLFDSLGVDVRLRMHDSQLDCDQDLLKGQTEGAISDLVRMEWMKRHGINMRLIGTTSAAWELFVSPSARVKQPKQLGDKMVAMTRHSATDYLTWRMLDGVNTSADVFRVQVNSLPLRLEMLINSEIDVAWLPEPQATKARQLKLQAMAESEKIAPRMGVMAFREKSLADKRRQEQLAAFCKAWNQACDTLNKYGIRACAPFVAKYCQVKEEVADSVPQQIFTHLGAPREDDVQRAVKFVELFPNGYTLND